MHPEQVIAALRFDPLVPVWVIVVLGLVALPVVGIAAWRRARGTVFRLAAFAVLILWLCGPRLVQEARPGLPEIGLLVVDQTEAMRVEDRAQLAEAHREQIPQEAAKLPHLELRTITVPERGWYRPHRVTEMGKVLADIP